MKRKVYVFGNPDLEIDSLPIKILPKLKKRFPEIDFEIKDPNEEWDFSNEPNGAPEEIVIIDSVVGIERPTVFENLENFSPPPRVSTHDFDAYTNLKYLKKLGIIKKMKIIGIPALSMPNRPSTPEQEAIEFITQTLSDSKYQNKNKTTDRIIYL